MLDVTFTILLVSANKKLDWIIFKYKVSSIDLILSKLEKLNKKCIAVLVCFGLSEDH